MKPHIRLNVRNTFGAFSTMFFYFKSEDNEEFHNVFRLTVDQFNRLYERVQLSLQKSTVFRDPLHAELKLAITLQ